MRLCLVPKEMLPPDRLADLDERLRRATEIDGECGPVTAWFSYQRFLYAFAKVECGKLVAIAEASGRPKSGPGWWIDPKFRGQGYGNDLVDALALHLKQDGVTGILDAISIQTPNGKFDKQSRRLVVRLRRHFEHSGRPTF